MPFWPRLRTFIDTFCFVFILCLNIFAANNFFLFETSAFADRFSRKCLEKNEAIHNYRLGINFNSIFTTRVCVTLKTHICVTGQNSNQCLKYMNSNKTERQRISVNLFIHNISINWHRHRCSHVYCQSMVSYGISYRERDRKQRSHRHFKNVLMKWNDYDFCKFLEVHFFFMYSMGITLSLGASTALGAGASTHKTPSLVSVDWTFWGSTPSGSR